MLSAWRELNTRVENLEKELGKLGLVLDKIPGRLEKLVELVGQNTAQIQELSVKVAGLDKRPS
jgi:hypothetical protein